MVLLQNIVQTEDEEEARLNFYCYLLITHGLACARALLRDISSVFHGPLDAIVVELSVANRKSLAGGAFVLSGSPDRLIEHRG